MRTSAALFLSLFAIAGCNATAPAERVPPDQARRLLIDRNWIDRLPESETDRLHVFRFTPQMGGGVYQDRTLYAGQFELFRFESTGDAIRFDLPFKHEKKNVGYRIERLSQRERRGPLDLRLTLDKSPRGPSVYYGMSGAEGHDQAALDAELQSLFE